MVDCLVSHFKSTKIQATDGTLLTLADLKNLDTRELLELILIEAVKTNLYLAEFAGEKLGEEDTEGEPG